jgi:hypothetical protein
MQAPAPHNLPAGQALDLDGQAGPADNEMSAEAAAAILARVQRAANRPEFEPQYLEPSSIGYWSGTADMAAGMLGTASEAAAMQFVGVSSPADDLQLLQQGYNAAPPFQQLLSAEPSQRPLARAPAPADQLAATAHAAAATTPPPAPPMVMELSPAPVAAAHEAQLPDIGLEGLDSPPPAPPFVAPDAADAPVAQPQQRVHANTLGQGQQQAQEQEKQQQQPAGHAEGTVKVSLMGRSIWHEHGSKASFPTDPHVPPALATPPALFCDPERGLEPTDDGRCICAQGERCAPAVGASASQGGKGGGPVASFYLHPQQRMKRILACAIMQEPTAATGGRGGNFSRPTKVLRLLLHKQTAMLPR